MADRADEPWVLSRRVAITRRSDAGFTAHVCVVCIDAVGEPLWVDHHGIDVCLADDGFTWVHHIPHHARSAVTTVFDTADQVVRWRVDICAATGVTMNGVPWFEPLPLHVLAWPDGSVELLGGDELDVALSDRSISEEDHARAHSEATRVIESITGASFAPLELAARHLAELQPFAR
jgi:predicted RNA-binding protein associated with RNAse of E/G family